MKTLILLIALFIGCNTKEESGEIKKESIEIYPTGMGLQASENDIFFDGVRQVANFRIDNENLVKSLLKDSASVNYYLVKSGCPPINFLSFYASDAITDSKSISINCGRAYTRKEMKSILIKQFGIYYGFNLQSRGQL